MGSGPPSRHLKLYRLLILRGCYCIRPASTNRWLYPYNQARRRSKPIPGALLSGFG